MNRTGLVAVGMAIAIVGYAVLYSGLTTLNPSLGPGGASVGVIDALIPGRVSACGVAKGPATPPNASQPAAAKGTPREV